jgi:hypothetical protein
MSLRACFGILDKIAKAICELYGVSSPTEQIRFESFWKPQGRRLDKKAENRWDQIRNIDNISLVALYSQATDLDPKRGVWREFKRWRNALEHALLIVSENDPGEHDPLEVIQKEYGDLVVSRTEFFNHSLLMLQMTRSIIFNYVFCVRAEAMRDGGDPDQITSLGPKRPG